MNRIRKGMTPLFALAVAVALGFGATQAVAAPGSARVQACSKIYPTWCSSSSAACANYCAQLGFAGSTCSDDPMRPRSCCTCTN